MNKHLGKPYPTIVAPSTGTGKPKPTKPGKPKRMSQRQVLVILWIYKMSGVAMVMGSGKLGGTVLAAGGQQGAFGRNLAIPRNRRSASQILARGIFSGTSSAWRALTSVQVEAWNQAAQDNTSMSLRTNVFGDIRKLSGSQMFQRVNNILNALGLAPVSSPPTSGTTDAITAAVGTADVSATQFDIAVTTFGGSITVPAGTHLEFYATSQKGSGISFFGKSQFRYVAQYAAATSINPLDVYADYIAKFGALVAGSRIGFELRFVFFNSGVMAIGGKVGGVVSVTA